MLKRMDSFSLGPPRGASAAADIHAEPHSNTCGLGLWLPLHNQIFRLITKNDKCQRNNDTPVVTSRIIMNKIISLISAIHLFNNLLIAR